MKKILLICSVIGIFFTGCWNKITDEHTKNYENSLNSMLKESLALVDLLLAYNGAEVIINDFKCENKSDYIECNSKTPSIKMSGQELLKINNIKILTNQIYIGKEKNEISISEAFKGMPGDNKYSKVSFENMQIGDFAKGLFGILALGNAEFANFNFLVEDDYKLEISQVFDKAYDLSTNFSLSSKNINLSSDLYFALGEAFFNAVDKSGVKFNVEKQYVNNEALLQNMENNIAVLNNVFLKDKVKLTISLENTELVKQALAMMQIHNDEFANKLSSSILSKKPHKIELEIKLKDKVCLNKPDEKDVFDSSIITVNGIEVTEDLLNGY